jgi:hypothetical protein
MWERNDDKKPASGLLVIDLPVLDILESKANIVTFPFSILMTQACDIKEFCDCIEKKENGNEETVGRQIITQMIFCPAFDEDSFADGTHLKQQYEYVMPKANKGDVDKIKDCHHIRYHYLKTGSDQIPSLIVDFKQYFTLPAMYIRKYLRENGRSPLRLDHLSYTHLADRFAHYLQRVALP